jgi:hypothetical protein
MMTVLERVRRADAQHALRLVLIVLTALETPSPARSRCPENRFDVKGAKAMRMHIVQSLIVACGIAAAQPFSADAAGILCLDTEGTCNDVKLVYDNTSGPGFFSVTGYEYGCGQPERSLDGSARVSGDTVYVEYTSMVSTSAATPRIGQYNLQLSLGALGGPYQYAYHYEGYHHGSGTMVAVPCPDGDFFASFVDFDEAE